MHSDTLYHFSDRPDIGVFVPRAPVLSPKKEALVYAIDRWHSPLYYFPRNCPRIGIWPVGDTSSQDRKAYEGWTSKRIRLFIERSSEEEWRTGALFVYEFDNRMDFEDTGDHGVWTSSKTQIPSRIWEMRDLPLAAEEAGVEVNIMDSLLETAGLFFDFEKRVFTTTLHVSMIRLSAYKGWPLPL